MRRLSSAQAVSLVISISPTLASYTPIFIGNVTLLGPQLTPDVNNVSRDGGYSSLINGNIVWLYDDTECMDSQGSQLSFVSNTAAFSASPRDNLTVVKDFGVVNVGKEKDGSPKNAILADTTVGSGGWVPFQPDELAFNQQMKGKERVAIWPGTSPTPISVDQAFLFAPLVYVDYKPQDPSKEYQGRGMTLISITASNDGPVATRQGDLIIPGTQIGFGGFTTLVGRKSAETASNDDGERDLYLLGVTNAGLQLARVGINNLATFSSYVFWDPSSQKFTSTRPKPGMIDNTKIYMPGTFTSGSVFYSPYFETFIMIYYNKHADSTFYIRFLDLTRPILKDKTWRPGGRDGQGIEAEDVEALVRYTWSPEQILYKSTPGKGGFNYAGTPHPEYFNRQYFAKSLYPDKTAEKDRRNEWYGSNFMSEDDANGKDGKFLLLSWTSQKKGGMDTGIYEIVLAAVEFGDIPENPEIEKGAESTKTTSSSPGGEPTAPPAAGFKAKSSAADSQGGFCSIWMLILGLFAIKHFLDL
ncbi:uncharacterized protein KY384_003147 [Bacidia gigantensis]|uniref:uncharacterized protein n=1 Tax=Bacidia gigantensis TaxID=2732470 RepID=UPI001D048883|nr:uncharacterized protein KY384_003147 [Bacidia gigantensis]KAG8531518.1 hypothetical protein KY384_003147 [Bacidia gigantensis]